jgi:hypothetical protein
VKVTVDVPDEVLARVRAQLELAEERKQHHEMKVSAVVWMLIALGAIGAHIFNACGEP